MDIKDIIDDELNNLTESEKKSVLEGFKLMGNPSKKQLELLKKNEGLFKKHEPVLRKVVQEEINKIIKEKVTKASITKAFNELSKISLELIANLEKYKSANDSDKEKYKNIARDLTKKKKAAEANLEKVVSMLDKNQALYIGEKTIQKIKEAGPGLCANIHAKRKRGEKMRKKGDKGAPSKKAWDAAKGD